MADNTTETDIVSASYVLDTLMSEHPGYTLDLAGRHINLILTGKCNSIAPSTGAYHMKREGNLIRAVSRTSDNGEHIMYFSGDMDYYDNLGYDNLGFSSHVYITDMKDYETISLANFCEKVLAINDTIPMQELEGFAQSAIEAEKPSRWGRPRDYIIIRDDNGMVLVACGRGPWNFFELEAI